MGGTDQCAYKRGDKILTSKDASEDNTTVDKSATDMDEDPTDDVTADKNYVPTDGDDDHAQSDEEDITNTPEEGYVHKPFSVVIN